ncbi:esterase [Amycolatopsis deserti]|uniref:Esterase n=1 Tax=Amycolatopsis deserti TaxID=185696 RepID=A0ABQ3IJJ0_9PSEU|nr:alpha/beta fold hydrolase [Amycolatopsis deserti]GHE80649.1 esterase [Amycolatopsis deserti]
MTRTGESAMHAPWTFTQAPVTSRRGFFWVTGDRVAGPDGSRLDSPMYVEWESPVNARPVPVVLVHGGGGQGTDWLATPDGRPGWAGYLVQDRWTVFVVDRPGHGRSPRPDAATAPVPPLEGAAAIFAPGTDEVHTQWPGPGGAGDPAVAQLAAGFTGLPRDLAAAQALEGARLAELLAQTGPAVLITHSAGAPAGWLAADARPDLVKAIVAIEPVGPPFVRIPEAGLSLDWGLTAAPLTYDPPATSAGDLDPRRPRALPRLANLPVAVVEADASPLAAACRPVAEHLNGAGVAAQHLRLAEHGVHGNGHGMMVELNNREVLDVVTGWLDTALAGDDQR